MSKLTELIEELTKGFEVVAGAASFGSFSTEMKKRFSDKIQAIVDEACKVQTLMNEYFKNKDEIKALKTKRAEGRANIKCSDYCNGTCIQREPDKENWCDSCLICNDTTKKIWALSRINAGILNKVRNISKIPQPETGINK